MEAALVRGGDGVFGRRGRGRPGRGDGTEQCGNAHIVQFALLLMPLTHDSYQGFHVGVPPGWDLSTLDGTVSVAKNTSGTEAALIYPAALTSGLTPSSFFASYMRYQQQLVAKSGASLTFQMQPDVGGLPRASVRVESKRLNVVGEASVAVLPLHTQFSSCLLYTSRCV